MALYVGITIWVFLILLLGLKSDSIMVAENWPNQPEEKTARRYKTVVSILVFLTFLFLWFLTAFRSSAIGNDTINYLFMFTNIFSEGLDPSWRIELGYQLFTNILYRFTQDGHIFLIIIATIMYSGVVLYTYKYSKNIAITLCLFFSLFFSPFASMFRQGIAMVIVLFGYQMIKKEKKIPAALLFILATTIHTSALVCFLLFLDLKVFEKRWFVFGLTFICAVVSFSGIVKIVIDAVLPKYSLYFESQYASSGWLAITYYLISYAVLYFLISKSLIEDYRPDRVVATNFALLLIFIAFGYAVNLFDRVSEYFLLIGITEFPNMMYRGKVKHFRLWLLGICTVFLIMFILILFFRPGWNHLYPYEFWRYN